MDLSFGKPRRTARRPLATSSRTRPRDLRQGRAGGLAHGAGAGRFLGALVRPLQAADADPGEGGARRTTARCGWSRSTSTRTRRIANQLRIQSIPTVYAFRDGRPLDGFRARSPKAR